MKVIFGIGILVFVAVVTGLVFQFYGNQDRSELIRETIPNPGLDQVVSLLQRIDSRLEKLSSKSEWQPAAAVVERTSVTPAIDLGEFSKSINEMKGALADFAREAQLQKAAIDSKKRLQEIDEYLGQVGRTQNAQALQEFFNFYSSAPREASLSIMFKSQMEIMKNFGVPNEIRPARLGECWVYRTNERGRDLYFRDGFVYYLE